MGVAAAALPVGEAERGIAQMCVLFSGHLPLPAKLEDPDGRVGQRG